VRGATYIDSGIRSAPALQTFQIVILAVLAAVVLFQLYRVLGKPMGRQPETVEAALPGVRPQPQAEELHGGVEGLAEVRAHEPGFELPKFLEGARVAYESIVSAFATGDRATLRNLVAAEVMPNFEQAIDKREAEGRSEQVEFRQEPRADVQSAQVDGDRARIQVRFLAELRSRSKGPEGEAVDDRRTADLWTFERRIGDPDPNWILIRVDAAEA
jgi:predicted lipid-binding transport protein (Tim44 family)